jgi:hypothetical protein
MEYSNQLDFILEELMEDYENRFKGVKFYSDEIPTSTKEEITKKVIDKFEIKEWEINVLYHHLLVDNYLKSVDPLIISLNGLIFKRNGGYKQKDIQTEAENVRIKTLENDLRNSSKGLTTFTGIVALGTLISALFFLLEIWKFFFLKG